MVSVVVLGMTQTGVVSAMGQDKGSNSPGKIVYEKANCIGCHKWHGGGGGGYGGAARSLRETLLDADGLREVIRCGRPFTGMPYHERSAYKGDDQSCYNTTAASLGDGVPPRARSFLRDRQVDDVIDYILTELKGKGEPTVEECIKFWGEGSRQCQAME